MLRKQLLLYSDVYVQTIQGTLEALIAHMGKKQRHFGAFKELALRVRKGSRARAKVGAQFVLALPHNSKWFVLHTALA